MNDCGREDQDLKFGMDIGGCDEGAWPHDYYNWLMYRNGRRAQMEFCSSPTPALVSRIMKVNGQDKFQCRRPT